MIRPLQFELANRDNVHVGSTVLLNSGSPMMTINSISVISEKDIIVSCDFFIEKDSKFECRSFFLSELTVMISEFE